VGIGQVAGPGGKPPACPPSQPWKVSLEEALQRRVVAIAGAFEQQVRFAQPARPVLHAAAFYPQTALGAPLRF